MNKKIAILALALCMVAAIAVTGTIAYFTDTDKETNTFTMGNVSIDLIEQERDKNGDLQTYVQEDKPLYPIVGSAQGAKDKNNLPVAENYVDKVITITNDGNQEAFVRFYFAIPSVLDDGNDTYNASMNVLHFNFGANGGDDGKQGTLQKEWLWKNNNGWQNFEMTMEGVPYNVYYAEYHEALGAGETTKRVIDGVYLDSTFNFDDNNNAYYYKNNKKVELKNSKGGSLTLDDIKNVKIPVFAIACQTSGFDVDNMDAAFDTVFGAQYCPWEGATVTKWWN